MRTAFTTFVLRNPILRIAGVLFVLTFLTQKANGKARPLPTLEGDWILVGYHMNNGKRFVEVPVSEPSPGDTPERWRFRADGTFLHLMDAKLGFSGTYSVIPMDIPPEQASTLREGNSFLVVTTDVVVTIPGMAERKAEYFHGIQKDDRIVLFYLGDSTNPKKIPNQGHTFRKSWKGGWTW